VVIDGVNMGCPCCGYHDCDNPLESVQDQFCTEHRQYNNECAVTSCSAAVEKGFKTCLDQHHRKLELHYYERGKAMFQLKAHLDRLRISQSHDSLSLGSIRHDQGQLTAPDELAIMAADLHPDVEENPDEDESTGLEGSGEGDDQVLMDSRGELCDGKLEAGNRTLRACFGRRRSHNEELCVASCGTIIGRQRFYGSEAPNGIRVRVLFYPH